MPGLGSPWAAGPSASAGEAVGLGQHCWCAGAGDHPCWPPADGSRRGGVNSWAPTSPLRFQGRWKAPGAGQGGRSLWPQGQDGGRPSSWWPMGRPCLPLAGGGWGPRTLAQLHGLWRPSGSAGPGGREPAAPAERRAVRPQRASPGHAEEAGALQKGKGIPQGPLAHLAGVRQRGAGPIPGGGSPDSSLRPLAGWRQESTGSVAVSPGGGRAGQEGGCCWASAWQHRPTPCVREPRPLTLCPQRARPTLSRGLHHTGSPMP